VEDWITLDRLHIRVHLWWVSRWNRRLLVVTGAQCPLTKPVVAAVELQAATEPHCSRGVQPGGICVYVGTARAGPRRSGVGLAPRPQALPMSDASLFLYMLISRRFRHDLTLASCHEIHRDSVLFLSSRQIGIAQCNSSADSLK
jgi:hypothetical protein